jgi:putative restriction endonuclease
MRHKFRTTTESPSAALTSRSKVRGGWVRPTPVPHSPETGFRYDGLFRVEESWRERGVSGFYVCRYRLVQLSEDGTPLRVEPAKEPGPPPREQATIQRIVRNTSVSLAVKQLHSYTCQVCGQKISIASGAYAEGAHIRPLGEPHSGPDVAENVLCLCPNDHVRFEYGAIMIEPDLTVTDAIARESVGPLRTVSGHTINPAHLAYHRDYFALGE